MVLYSILYSTVGWGLWRRQGPIRGPPPLVRSSPSFLIVNGGTHAERGESGARAGRTPLWGKRSGMVFRMHILPEPYTFVRNHTMVLTCPDPHGLQRWNVHVLALPRSAAADASSRYSCNTGVLDLPRCLFVSSPHRTLRTDARTTGSHHARRRAVTRRPRFAILPPSLRGASPVHPTSRHPRPEPPNGTRQMNSTRSGRTEIGGQAVSLDRGARRPSTGSIQELDRLGLDSPSTEPRQLVSSTRDSQGAQRTAW